MRGPILSSAIALVLWTWKEAAVVTVVAAQPCTIRPQPAPQGKTLYRLGVLANRGIETVYKEWNATAEYLTKTAGTLFDPPLIFETVPVLFDDRVLDEFESPGGAYDFMFANPAITTCVSSEVGAQSLNTVIAKRKVGGSVYELTNFGGVIITQADNNDINTLQDIKGKRVGVISISGLGR